MLASVMGMQMGLLWCAAAQCAGVPTVEISNPIGGWSSERIVEVKGTVSGGSVSRATLVVNGFSRWIDVRGGHFSATIVVSKGSNSIEVIASNIHGTGSSSVNFYSDVPAVDMQVVLNWDTNGTDVDLHVTDPSDEECFFSHKTTKMGGRLDVDDTDGHGPEVFTLSHAGHGEYLVEAKYYSSHEHPQTKCVVQVILFEGSDRERRLEFEKILTKTGDKVEVGLFNLSPPEQMSN
jgi:uncharacterized protein YfaP (DUF2135 family)